MISDSKILVTYHSYRQIFASLQFVFLIKFEAKFYMINKVIFFKNVKYMMYFASAALLAILATIQKDSYLTPSQSVSQFFFNSFLWFG